MILAAAYLLWMFQRLAFGELSDFLKGLGGHLTDMTPTEILTLAPLGALVVAFGIFPGLLLGMVQGSVDTALGDAVREAPIVLGQPATFLMVAIPILYVVGRIVWVARIDLGSRSAGTDQPAEAVEGAR
jgi:hypothetical protein